MGPDPLYFGSVYSLRVLDMGQKPFFFIQFSGLQHTESGLCTYLVLVRKCFFLFGAISCWFRRTVANSPVDESTSNVKAGLGA